MQPKANIYRQVAELHIMALNQSFLARLGPRFLSLLYEKIDQAPGYHLITQDRNGRVIGFVSGGPGMGRIYRALLASLPRLILSLLPNILMPRNAWGVLELLRYRGRDATASGPDHELISIAVSTDARGTGVSVSLFQDLVRAFGAAGVDDFKIVVGDSLEQAHHFYKKMQAQPLGKVEVHGGMSSTLYKVESKRSNPAKAGH